MVSDGVVALLVILSLLLGFSFGFLVNAILHKVVK